MTTQQVILWTSAYFAELVLVVWFTRATPRRVAGALAGGAVVGLFTLAAIVLCQAWGLWQVPIRASRSFARANIDIDTASRPSSGAEPLPNGSRRCPPCRRSTKLESSGRSSATSSSTRSRSRSTGCAARRRVSATSRSAPHAPNWREIRASTNSGGANPRAGSTHLSELRVQTAASQPPDSCAGTGAYLGLAASGL